MSTLATLTEVSPQRKEEILQPLFGIEENRKRYTESFINGLTKHANSVEKLWDMLNKPGFITGEKIKYCSGSTTYLDGAGGREDNYDVATVKEMCLSNIDTPHPYVSHTKFLAKELGAVVLRVLIESRNEEVLSVLLKSPYEFRVIDTLVHGHTYIRESRATTLAAALYASIPPEYDPKTLSAYIELTRTEKAYLDQLIREFPQQAAAR